MYGFFLRAISYTGYALAYSPWLLYAMIPFDALGSISDPCLGAVMVSRIDPHENGALQGVSATMRLLLICRSPCVAVHNWATVIHFVRLLYGRPRSCD